ncbi:MAG: AAA family ATPase, partial [Maioricimonas sp. JB049]
MLTELTVENYRGFKRYHLPELRRVNLLVGRNNCGKTSLLEAVRLFAAQGHPLDIAAIAIERGEVRFVSDSPRSGSGEYCPEVAHFFHGHRIAPDLFFFIRA